MHFSLLGHTTGSLKLKVSFIPYVRNPKVPRQRIGVSVNGTKIADWVATVDTATTMEVVIPEGIIGEILNIEFDLPDAVSPGAVGTGVGSKPLGIAMLQMNIIENE